MHGGEAVEGVPLPVGSDGRAGGPHAATNARRPAAAISRDLLHQSGARLAQLLLDRGAVDGLAVSGKRLLPRGDRVGEALLPESQLAEVVLHAEFWGSCAAASLSGLSASAGFPCFK